MKPLILSAYQTMVTKSVMYSVHKIKHFFSHFWVTPPVIFITRLNMCICMWHCFMSISVCLYLAVYLFQYTYIYWESIFTRCFVYVYLPVMCACALAHIPIYTRIYNLWYLLQITVWNIDAYALTLFDYSLISITFRHYCSNGYTFRLLAKVTAKYRSCLPSVENRGKYVINEK